VPALPTPCARDGKGPGHQRGLPDLIESGDGFLPTATATAQGSNRSTSPEATQRHSPGTIAGALLPTPTAADSRSAANATAGRVRPSAAHPGRTLTDAARLLPTPRATDGTKGCPGQRGSAGDLTLPSAAVRILPTPTGSDGRGPGRHGSGGADLRTAVYGLHPAVPSETGAPPRVIEPNVGRWGGYAAAIARWEHLLGQPVPDPTQTGRHGKPVLAPRFVEWLMGLPPGWVTDLELPRTVALRVLGNGVVPQQAAHALQQLLCPHRCAPA